MNEVSQVLRVRVNRGFRAEVKSQEQASLHTVTVLQASELTTMWYCVDWLDAQ